MKPTIIALGICVAIVPVCLVGYLSVSGRSINRRQSHLSTAFHLEALTINADPLGSRTACGVIVSDSDISIHSGSVELAVFDGSGFPTGTVLGRPTDFEPRGRKEFIIPLPDSAQGVVFRDVFLQRSGKSGE